MDILGFRDRTSSPPAPTGSPSRTNRPITLRSTTMTRRSCCPAGSSSAPATSTSATRSWQPASRHPVRAGREALLDLRRGPPPQASARADGLTSGLLRRRSPCFESRLLRQPALLSRWPISDRLRGGQLQAAHQRRVRVRAGVCFCRDRPRRFLQTVSPAWRTLHG